MAQLHAQSDKLVNFQISDGWQAAEFAYINKSIFMCLFSLAPPPPPIMANSVLVCACACMYVHLFYGLNSSCCPSPVIGCDIQVSCDIYGEGLAKFSSAKNNWSKGK